MLSPTRDSLGPSPLVRRVVRPPHPLATSQYMHSMSQGSVRARQSFPLSDEVTVLD